MTPVIKSGTVVASGLNCMIDISIDYGGIREFGSGLNCGNQLDATVGYLMPEGTDSRPQQGLAFIRACLARDHKSIAGARPERGTPMVGVCLPPGQGHVRAVQGVAVELGLGCCNEVITRQRAAVGTSVVLQAVPEAAEVAA